MDQQNNQVEFHPINHYEEIDTRQLELWFLSNYQKRMANCITSFLVSWCLFSVILFFFIIDKKQFEFVTLWVSYSTIIMMILSIRFWWIWWWNPTDDVFWIGAKIRISSMLHLISLSLAALSTVLIKISNLKDSLFLDIAFIIPSVTTTGIMNILNVLKLLRLWFVWNRVRRFSELQRRFDENIFQSVIRNREGYREVRQEIESAGIHGGELDEIQRMEWQNARNILRQIGNGHFHNINFLRLLLNIDGDRNPEDTDENRVIIYSRIKCIKYDKSKLGNSDSCSICWNDFENNESVKILPKWAHIFHEDCIEKWILKARHNNICCPVWRVNIKEELDAEEAKEDNMNPVVEIHQHQQDSVELQPHQSEDIDNRNLQQIADEEIHPEDNV